jgi:MFS family permease
MPSCESITVPGAAQVDRAIRLSYAQMMLNAVFAASTGGMFLVGFALELGADNVMLGLLTAIPSLFVVFQFVSAAMVERRVSRKTLTVAFSLVMPLCWFLIALIPLLGPALGRTARFGILIGVIATVTLAAQFVINARSSWIGELIPPRRRGRFFGRCTMFAGLVGAAFAVAEGSFLDIIRSHGLLAFTGLFFFGAVFGLASGILNMPQPDCPLPRADSRPSLMGQLRETFRNRRFVHLALVHAVMALGGIAGPFSAAYCLRDVGLSFLALGLINAVSTASSLLLSPYWGKLVDRFGCRPILVLGLAAMAPCSALWLFIPPGARGMAYSLLPLGNLIAGAASAAVSVAISTLMYKTSRPQGRSVQFAAYSVFVSLVAAPMPVLGGWLVLHLERAGYPIDLRLTFYLWSLFMFAAALAAWRMRETGAVLTRSLVFSYFPSRLARFWGAVTSMSPFFASPMRFNMPAKNNGAQEPADNNGTPQDTTK